MKGWLRNDAALTSVPFSPPDPGVPVPGVRRPGEKELMGRMTLAFTPPDSDFDATLKLAASDYEDDGPSAGQQLFSCGAFTAGRTYGATDPTGSCRFDDHYSASGLPNGVADNWPYARQQPYTDNRIYLGSLTANYRMGDVTLTSVTGYFRTDTSYSDNYDATSFYQLGASEHEEYDAISQELRLRGLTLTDLDERRMHVAPPQLHLHAEVPVQQLGLLLQALCRTAVNNRAVLHDIDAVGDGKRTVEVLLDEQHR